MTWMLVVLTVIMGFTEYCCAHYLLQKTLKTTENRAHIILSILVSGMIMFPTKLIWLTFIVTLFFTPLVLWVGIQLGRLKK